jgi:hypothetical protein
MQAGYCGNLAACSKTSLLTNELLQKKAGKVSDALEKKEPGVHGCSAINSETAVDAADSDRSHNKMMHVMWREEYTCRSSNVLAIWWDAHADAIAHCHTSARV